MNEQRIKLLELMKTLKFPVTEEEAEKTVKNLSDSDVEYLLSYYDEVMKYEDGVESFVRQFYPEEYQKLEEDYKKKVSREDDEYTWQMQKSQEDEDIQLDAIDAKKERELEEIVKTEENDVDQIDALQQGIYDTLKPLASEEDKKDSTS